MHNISKLRHNFVLNENLMSFSRCEFAVVKALHVPWLSPHVPAIEQYFLGLMVGNSPKHFQKGLFGIFQREVSACIYAEKSGFEMHVLLKAHCFSNKEGIVGSK